MQVRRAGSDDSDPPKGVLFSCKCGERTTRRARIKRPKQARKLRKYREHFVADWKGLVYP
jgi:hypothetical protein